MAKVQVVRLVRHSLKKKDNHVSHLGRKLAAKLGPAIMAGVSNNCPVYVGPLPRCRETGAAMGINDDRMQNEPLFDSIPGAELAPLVGKAKPVMKAQSIDAVTAILQLAESDMEAAITMQGASGRYREGIKEITARHPDADVVAVICHGGSIEPAANIATGLKELEYVDIIVVDGEIAGATEHRRA